MTAAVASTMTSVPSAMAAATCCAATHAIAPSTWHAAVNQLEYALQDCLHLVSRTCCAANPHLKAIWPQ